jgi:hypothetical protein
MRETITLNIVKAAPITDEEAIAVEAFVESVTPALERLTLPAMCEAVARLVAEYGSWAALAGN